VTLSHPGSALFQLLGSEGGVNRFLQSGTVGLRQGDQLGRGHFLRGQAAGSKCAEEQSGHGSHGRRTIAQPKGSVIHGRSFAGKLWVWLRAIWSFVDQGDVEGKLSIATLGFWLLLRSFPFVHFGDYGSLGIQAEPVVADVFEDVGKNALLQNWTFLPFPSHDVGAVDDGYGPVRARIDRVWSPQWPNGLPPAASRERPAAGRFHLLCWFAGLQRSLPAKTCKRQGVEILFDDSSLFHHTVCPHLHLGG
jgi:hypothetical protein